MRKKSSITEQRYLNTKPKVAMRWYFHGHKVDFCQLLAVLLVVNIIQNMVYIQNDEKKIRCSFCCN